MKNCFLKLGWLPLVVAGCVAGPPDEAEAVAMRAEMLAEDDCLDALIGMSVCDEASFAIEGYCLFEWAYFDLGYELEEALDFYDLGYAIAEKQCGQFRSFRERECALTGTGCSPLPQ